MTEEETAQTGSVPSSKYKLYKLLEVEKTATPTEIKKAFQKQARVHHPDRGGDENKFKEIQHAYEVLSDEQKRSKYDKYGDEGEKAGGPRGEADGFADVFDMFGGRGGGFQRGGPRRGPDVQHTLNISLEEFFNGTSKKLNVTKKVQQGEKVLRQKKQLEVHIDRGMKSGQMIRFSGEGDEKPGVEPGDIVFVLREKPHPRFTREGANLVLKQDIFLSEALSGCKIIVDHLDGRKLLIKSQPGEIIEPNSKKMVIGEGMPVHRRDDRGVLIVQFNVRFPENGSFTAAEKRVLNCALPPPVACEPDLDIETYVVSDPSEAQQSATEEPSRMPSHDRDEDMGPEGAQCAQQ